MEFKKYNSIENAYRQKMVDSISMYFPKSTFVVQEKIHGANFSIWADKGEIRFAKRSGFIEEGEKFYGYERAMDKLELQLSSLKIASILSERSCVVYGELFGGSYEGVEPIKGVSKVQRGVNYSPDVEFMAFDVYIDGERIPTKEANRWLDKMNILRVPELMTGTLSECLQHANDFNSKVPQMLGLEELEENIVEGTVIKLYDEVGTLPNGKAPILKNKNEKFSEKSKVRKPKTPTKTPEHLVEYEELLISMVNENRLKNVISKIGPITEIKSAFNKVMKPFSEDILEDFKKEAEGFEELSKEDQKFVTSKIGKNAANLIRANLGNILDGEL